jgi:hypothetical protein
MRNLLILAILPLALSAETFPMAFYKPPSPLPDKAVVEDWPRFFGPRDNCTTNEGPLLKTFPETGLPIVFELDRGDSYSSPILVDGKLLHFHAVNSAETLDYHDAETDSPPVPDPAPSSIKGKSISSESPRCFIAST